jgi:hypothetical protein
VALSNLENILAEHYCAWEKPTIYSHTLEFAKEEIPLFSKFWASNAPINAPAASYFLHWIVTVIVLLAPPPGDAYEYESMKPIPGIRELIVAVTARFIVDLYTYPGA